VADPVTFAYSVLRAIQGRIKLTEKVGRSKVRAFQVPTKRTI